MLKWVVVLSLIAAETVVLVWTMPSRQPSWELHRTASNTPGEVAAAPSELGSWPISDAERTLWTRDLRAAIQWAQIGKFDPILVTAPDSYPASAVVFIRTFEDCTGFLYGDNMVATAGHCLYYRPGNAWAKQTRVFIGRHGSSNGVECTGVRLFAPEGFTRFHREDYDYGAIRIACNGAVKTGTLGMRVAASLPRPTLLGYHGSEKRLQNLGVSSRAGLQFFYKHDTEPGTSGSPLFVLDKSCAACVVAMHTTPPHDEKTPHSRYNHGVRLDARMIADFGRWKATP